MENLLRAIAKRYEGKGVAAEDLYQEAWVVYLENTGLESGKLISKLRTRLGRMLRKEYRYNQKENLEKLVPENLQTPEEILEKRRRNWERKLDLQTLPLLEYTVVVLVLGLVGNKVRTYKEVGKMMGRSARWVGSKIKEAQWRRSRVVDTPRQHNTYKGHDHG